MTPSALELEIHALDSSEVSSPSSGEVDYLFFVEAKFDITQEVGGNPGDSIVCGGSCQHGVWRGEGLQAQRNTSVFGWLRLG